MWVNSELIVSQREALVLAVDQAGGQTGLAKICGCTQGAVWQMLNKPEPQLSWQFVLKVEAALGISRHDLRPDVYPRAACAA